MKRKLAEKVFDIQTPQDEIGSKKESSLNIPEASKENKSRKNINTIDLIKPKPPLTRSSTKNITSNYNLAKETLAQGHPAPVEKTYTSPRESEKTIKWMHKKLKEDQDLIIWLKESKRVSYISFQRHFKECGTVISNACATLTDAQSKLRRNALLFRKVGNLKRKNMSLRKENSSLKLRMKVDDEARGNLELLAEVVEL
jgi:hypothetical protein